MMPTSTQSAVTTTYLESNIRPGTYVYWDRVIWHIESWSRSAPDELQVVNYLTGDSKRLSLMKVFVDRPEQPAAIFRNTVAEIEDEIYVQRVRSQEIVDSAGLSPRSLEFADKVIRTVEHVRRYCSTAAMTARIRGEEFSVVEAKLKALEELGGPVGKSQFYAWESWYDQASGDRAKIAATCRRSDKGKARTTSNQEHLLDTFIMRYKVGGRKRRKLRNQTVTTFVRETLTRTGNLWIDRSKCGKAIPSGLVDSLLDPEIPIASILANLDYAPLLSKIEPPSDTVISDYCNWYRASPTSAAAQIRSRADREEWESQFMVFDQFVHLAQFPNQYVFADYWEIDIHLVDDETRSIVYKVWLTMLIDAFSRSIVGFAIHDHAPRIESIQTALLHAIYPKTSHLEWGIEEDWSCYGSPRALFLDNAWANLSGSLRNLSRHISRGGQFPTIDLVFRPPYKARYGAIIERIFLNFHGWVTEYLDGAILGTSPRAVAQSRRSAVLLFEDLNESIHRLVVKYQHTYHSELGMTPHEKWMEGIALVGPEKVPPRTREIELLFMREYHQPRKILRQGVSIFGEKYGARDSAAIPRYFPPDKTEDKPSSLRQRLIPYAIKYDPDDISRIYVFNDGVFVGELPMRKRLLPDGSTNPISLAQLKIARKLSKIHSGTARGWMEFAKETEERGVQRRREQKKIRNELIQKANGTSPSIGDMKSLDELLQSGIINLNEAYTRNLQTTVEDVK